MHHLIIVVITLVLSAAATVTVLNYTPAESLIRHQVMREAQNGLALAEAGVIRYLDANRDGNGYVLFPGEAVDLAPQVSPEFGFLPAPIRGRLQWSITTGFYQGLPGVGICLFPVSGTLTDKQKSDLIRIQESLPAYSAVVANDCAAQNDVKGGDHLTYWVILTHLD